MHLYANFLFCPAQFNADAPSVKPTKCLQTRLTLALPYGERDKQCSQCKLQTHIDVRGSVHHSIIHKEKSNNMSKFYYSIFVWSSTCFGRHAILHQEPKTALAASGFSYVKGCWTCSWWTLSGTVWEGVVHLLVLCLKAGVHEFFTNIGAPSKF
jgi:hypothetical protein